MVTTVPEIRTTKLEFFSEETFPGGPLVRPLDENLAPRCDGQSRLPLCITKPVKPQLIILGKVAVSCQNLEYSISPKS
jgi:hypothetical protein